MAPSEEREAIEEEEVSLSPSDLPVAADKDDDGECKSSDAEDDFEFRISVAGGLLSHAAETDMCAADEVFFQGQILPLRPSVGSDSGFFVASRTPSRSRSMSDSLDQYSSTVLGLGFNSTSRSNSSGSSSRSSSGCVSRSHSSNSHGSSTCEHPRVSLSNNFYAHPSPTPQVRILRNAHARRRSTSSAPPGWGIFRLGIAKAPEIELYDIRSRRSNSGSVSGRKSNADAEDAKKALRGTNRSTSKNAADVQKKAASQAAGRGFSCKCSPDALEPVAIPKLGVTKKKKEQQTTHRSRGELNG
ncbi:unnamed protein product [Musa acuminata subsp. burmannicoides]